GSAITTTTSSPVTAEEKIKKKNDVKAISMLPLGEEQIMVKLLMCDRKNNVLFTDTECLVLSSNFMIPDESQILLRVYRKNNMYSVDMKNIVPKESLTCLNRALVVKPYNMTHYELFRGRRPTLSFMRPFSKAFRVYYLRTRKVEENLHIKFLENKPIVAGARPEWLFDIDMLTKLMNYVLVLKDGSPLFDSSIKLSHDAGSPSSVDAGKKHDEVSNKESGASNELNYAFENLSTEYPDDLKMLGLETIATYDDSKKRLTLLIWSLQSKSILLLLPEFTRIIDSSKGKIDQTLFIKRQKGDILLIQVYVDDIIFSSTKKELCTKFERLMKDKFQMSSLGELTFFLGLQSASTLVDIEKTLVKDADGDDVDVHLYRSMIRSLMYFTASRPNIMYAVCVCARFQVTPKVFQLHAIKRVFRYLKGHPKLSLWYPRDSLFELVTCTDSDYAGASLDRKFTTGGCQFLGSRSISWQCKKQTMVSTSTTEVEYQFWATVKVKTVNEEEQIQALVDNKKVIIIEISVRSDLHLEDAEGTECLPTAIVFKQLTLMGVKTTAWNEFSSTMASAIIYLATNQKFNFSKYIFDHMKHKSKKSKKRITEVPQLSDSTHDVADKHVTTTSNDPLFSGSSTRVESSEDAGLGDQEDASKHERMIDDLDVDEGVALVDETQRRNDQDMFDTSILDDAEVVAEKEVSTADLVPTAGEVVTSAVVKVSTTAITSQISMDEITLAKALFDIKTSKPKAKRIVMQEPKLVKDSEKAAKGSSNKAEATPLSSKSLTTVDYKIYKEWMKSFSKTIRVGGNSQNYLTFGQMFKNFNREDLEVQWSIVKARFKKTKPVGDMDNLLFQTLKIMFEHHIEDNIWKYQ
nr:hypothetical protein [Tanacetum cinerariifolium]